MSDECKLRIVKTEDTHDHEHYEELLSLDLLAEGLSDNFFKETAIQLLGEREIEVWLVTDNKSFINVGASFETQEVIIFLTGAGAVAFTKAVANIIESVLRGLASKALGREISDAEALARATIRRRNASEYGQLLEMKRTDNGNRVFRFADGAVLEIDTQGNTVREEYPEGRDAGSNRKQ